MKKVLKLSSLLAAVLLLTVLAGVQLLTAQATQVELDNAYVSNMESTGADSIFRATLTYGVDPWVETATTTITVKNNTTEEEPNTYTLQANASSTAGIWLLDVQVTAATSSAADQTSATPVAGRDEDAGLGTVHGVHGDELHVSFSPPNSFTRSATITVDTEGPEISGLSPSHNFRAQGGLIRFTATVSDADSGVGGDADAAAANTEITLDGEEVVNKATKPADGSTTVTVNITLPEGVYDWNVTARDALGNAGASEAVAAVEDDPDTDADETMAAVADNRLVVDDTDPSLASAMTGTVLDTSGDTPMPDMTGNRKAIAVTFTDGGPDAAEEDGGLDGTTVDDSDFRVDVGNQSMDIADVTWDEALPKMVFITLENELAGDDEPTVRLVGPVDDIAGNSTGTGEVEASDGIAPTLTVSVDASGGTVTVLVSADEDSRNPSRRTGVTVRNVVENDDGDQEGGDDTASAAEFRTVTSNEQWEWTFEFDDDEAGKYNVCVMVNDIAGDTGNTGEAGTCGEGTALSEGDDGTSITFEVDTGVPAPAVTPEATDNTGAFIEIDFSAEASEYVGDSMGKISSITVMIDGEAAETATLDSKVFSIAPPADGYAVGELELTVTATDESGNTATFKEIMVEITERDPFTVNLRPGYNLISLPGTPASTDINDVIGADHSINQVLTYSPFVEGGWLSAERGDDGAFAGTLTTIDGSTAYIVRTTSFDPLKVDIPRMTLGNVLPPQTNLGVGWNLVPVIDLSSDLGSGDTIADYFQGVGDAILTIDDSGRLQAIDTDDGVVGKGYWVYASRAAVLLPTRR